MGENSDFSSTCTCEWQLCLQMWLTDSFSKKSIHKIKGHNTFHFCQSSLISWPSNFSTWGKPKNMFSFLWRQQSKVPHNDHFVHCQSIGLSHFAFVCLLKQSVSHISRHGPIQVYFASTSFPWLGKFFNKSIFWIWYKFMMSSPFLGPHH